MAARYVNTENVAAQGQSFYTGLLPGSYEKGGGGGGSNVMGKGSGGSAGVSADRTGSTAAQQSITGYPKGGSILGKKEAPPEVTVANMPPGGFQGQQGQQGQQGPQGPSGGGPIPTPGPKPSGLLGMGALIPGAPPGGAGQGTRTPQGLGTGQRPQHQGGGTSKVLGTAVGAGVGTYVGGQTGNPTLGRAAGVASGAIATHGFEKMGDKLSESPIGRSVQRMASTRAHTRQPGVQQSATQQSIPFPNMANSTDRSLNF